MNHMMTEGTMCSSPVVEAIVTPLTTQNLRRVYDATSGTAGGTNLQEEKMFRMRVHDLYPFVEVLVVTSFSRLRRQ